MDMDNIFIAKVAIQKQNMNERHCYDITPILGSLAGHREKRSHNRMIDPHWT